MIASDKEQILSDFVHLSSRGLDVRMSPNLPVDLLIRNVYRCVNKRDAMLTEN